MSVNNISNKSNIIFGGIEGGATCSKVALYNGVGTLLVELHGPGINFWIIGVDETKKRIAHLIEEAKNAAKLLPGTSIRCMCLSMSGAEDEKVNETFRKDLMKSYPKLCNEYVICSDTVAPIATASDQGGIVMISGTGSNCLLINPDKSEGHCGGWGHMLGDEGSAFWIALKAIKIYFDSEDNFEPPPNGYSTNVVWKTIQEHFNIKNRYDILPIMYKDFEKSKVAKLTKELSDKARLGDPLSKWLFEMAGRMLAKHVIATSKQAHPKLIEGLGGLPVLCVGSVWKSFDLLKPGFVKQLQESCITELSLINLTVTAATGATYLAAKHANYNLPRDYSKNFTIFFHYKRD